ncbi:MAG TPA: restriction endonuclease subunit S, partial [bacterium]|nr:restriction endonuclease subunit S [bacterium]
AGYTNDKTKVYSGNLPIVVFGDHTRIFKFVDFPFALGADGVKILVPKKEIDVNYYYYLRNLRILSAGYSRHYKFLKEKKIKFPPLPTQKAIVSILEKAEKAKEWRKKADDLTKDFLKSVFLEMFYGGKYNEVELKEICDTRSGGTPSRSRKEYWDNGTIPWLGSTVCKDRYVNESKQFITKNGLNNSSARIFKKGTILVALVGATIGKTAYLNFEATTNQNIAGIFPKENVDLNSEYLFYAMQNLYPKFISLSSSTFKMANLTFVRNLKIPLPPIPLQNKFTLIVKEVEKLKEKQKKSREEIDNLFNALMQKAFKGELIV